MHINLSPVIHQDIWSPDVGRGYPQVLDLSILWLIPSQIVICPLLTANETFYHLNASMKILFCSIFCSCIKHIKQHCFYITQKRPIVSSQYLCVYIVLICLPLTGGTSKEKWKKLCGNFLALLHISDPWWKAPLIDLVLFIVNLWWRQTIIFRRTKIGFLW